MLTFDLRGQGENGHARSGFGYRELIEWDLPALLEAARERYPDRPVSVVAHSLGGQLATLAASRGLITPDALVLVAAGTAHWKHWPRRSRAKAFLIVSGVALAGCMLPRYPGRRLGFGGDQPRQLMLDWSYNAFTGRYRSVKDRHPLEPRGAAGHPPVLSIEIDGDEVAPSGAVEALVSRFAATSVYRKRLPPTVGASPWARHFSWARRPETVVRTIRDWERQGRRVRRAS